MSGERHRVTPLPDGTYRVVTTRERILTEAQLVELGIPVPAVDLPWKQEKSGPPPERLRNDPNALPSPFQVAIDYWKEHLGGFDSRLPILLREALQEFGLNAVLGAFDEVKEQRNLNVPKYERLKALLKGMRGGGR